MRRLVVLARSRWLALLMVVAALTLTACTGPGPDPNPPAADPPVVDRPAPPVEPGPEPAPLPRLHVDGLHFRRDDGTRFAWVGLTAFALLDQVAERREAEAVALLDWASARGVTVVRVLSTCTGWLVISPEEGRAALPRLLQLAAARGLYVEVVGLAATKERAFDHRAHLAALGAICGAATNCLIEVANEPSHSSQADVVGDPTYLASLAKLIPTHVLVSLGAPHGADDESDRYIALSDYGTVHTSRQDGDGHWRWVRQGKEAADLARRLGKPVVDDEPMGAGEELQLGKRDNDPTRWRAKGMLSRVLPLPGTFHYQDGLLAKVPTGRQLACFDAWRAGQAALPAALEEVGTFQDAGHSTSVITDFDGTRVLRIYGSEAGGRLYAVLLNLTGDPRLELQDGWRVDQRQSWGAVALWRVTRTR